MMHRKVMLSVLAIVAPLLVGGVATSMNASSASADGELVDLCIGAGIDKENDGGEACVYSAWDAPLFNADVCWDGQTSVVKGEGACELGATAFSLKYGEVIDVESGEVAAYAALPNSCDYVACEPNYQNNPYEDGVACCTPGGECTPPDANGNCPVGDVTWCKQIEEQQDGTVICYE